MTNKPLIVLGVVTALAMAGGQAIAAPCPASTTESHISSHNFSCTSDGLTFSAFSLTGIAGNTPVEFAGDTVTFGNAATTHLTTPGATAAPMLDYTVSSASGLSLDSATLTQHGELFTEGRSNARASVDTVYTGTPLTLHTFATRTNTTGNITASGSFSPVSSIVVDNSGHVALNTAGGGDGASHLGEVINSFTTSATPPPPPVPEPMSLSLFGLGLAGLALARRRRS